MTLALQNRSRRSCHAAAWRLLRSSVLGGCSLLLWMVPGCVSPALQSETIDVVHNPDLVRQCTLRSEGTYTAMGEKNALTMAKNSAVRNGGNVLLLVSVDKSDSLTTAVSGKIYACARRP